MKRWIILSAALLLVLLLAACGGDQTQSTAAPDETEAQLHTVAPSAVHQEEPEWAHIDAELTLEDASFLYAKGSDFLCFALVGSGDSAELRFKLDDTTAEMLRGQSPDNAYFLTINGEKIGSVKLNETCDELTLDGNFSYQQLCELANTIRGL